MGARNDDLSLKLAKAVDAGFLPDIADNEVDYLSKRAKTLFGQDIGFGDPLATDSTRLGRWRSAIANRKMRILVVADSWGDGNGASTWDKSWIRRITSRLRAEYFPGATAGGSYMQGGLTAVSASSPYAGTLANSAAYQDYMGFGRRCINFPLASSSVTFTFTGTGADLYIGHNGGTASAQYTVDGGAAVPISIAATGQTIETPGNRVQIRGLTAGSHTIVVSNGTLNFYLEGWITYNGDENNGVAIFDSTRTNQGTLYWTTGTHRWLPQATLVDPQLVVIALGINDFQEPTQKVTSTVFKAQYKTLITSIRSAIPSGPSIVICVPPESAGAGVALSPFSEFQRAIYEIAVEDGNITVYDSTVILGDTIASTNVWGYRADSYHVNDAGHQAYADGLYQILTKFP